MELAWFAILVNILALTGAVLVHGQPDTKFIDTGTNKEIAATYITQQTFRRQYQNLRIFPDGTRNCYTLTPVIKSNRYLLRASFAYGNYDGLDQPPQFDAYVGVNPWNLNLPTNSTQHSWNEIIIVATLDYISVCLVNTGKGTPYISALELRPLKNLAYLAANESQSLRLLYRNHFRQTTIGTPIRYPDDAYDRIWSIWVRDGWTPINNSSPVNLWSDDYHYRLPLPVINTAVIPSDPNNNLTFYFPTNGDPKLQYHVYMHFAELQKLKSNQSREFNIIVNGDLFYGPFSPDYLHRRTIYSISPLSGENQHEIVISKTTSSTLPPIFNAEEIFVLELLSATPTDSIDVDAIIKVKAIYQIKRNWIGDPCVPVNYSWDGLNCSYVDSNPPTIISLDLSSSGLLGELATSLANLTSIQSLDVSNNSLTGPVPDFLTELSSLKILNLSNNQFTGSIPTILLEKSKNGSLLLSYDYNTNPVNNMNQSTADSCKKQRQFVVPLLASVILALLIC